MIRKSVNISLNAVLNCLAYLEELDGLLANIDSISWPESGKELALSAGRHNCQWLKELYLASDLP